ncbi:GntR family transcriptional regulator [Bacillus pinisoli]|uniref:GntR family transcriptional regulator n=1 Tax=Bacillus pinisoli TaxID=2901866 RepID=UPI001FF5D04C|nr:GntR family transcriptional regulator [Bacillus pinisoli]
MNKPKTMTEYAYEELKNNILAGVYKPGDKLTEVALANELNVSRTPIRDALQRLGAEGLVTITPHKGIMVTKLTKKDVQDYYQVRKMLEGLAAKLAAENATETELALFREFFEGLEELFEREKGLDNYKDIAKKNVEFHRLICQMAKNDVLAKMLENLASPITVVRSTNWSTFKDRKNITMEEHRKIAYAILAKDSKLAQEAAEEHIQQALETSMLAVQDEDD